jgi:purine nucleoside phosphorylase
VGAELINARNSVAIVRALRVVGFEEHLELNAVGSLNVRIAPYSRSAIGE